MYALFEGLLGSDAFPFDARAEGVVFGDGAALLALERLPDALSSDVRLYAVIRGVGLSCDGKKASVSEPNAAGQALAIRRANANAGVQPRTEQLIEGHGISDPATDATEIQALRTVFADAPGTLSPRPVQSVKSLVGHSVWAAGAASVAKMCRALEEHVVPPQHNFSTPNAGAQFDGLQVPTARRAWPPNYDGEPRRAGVSAFGLGGTNAHAVVEAFSRVHHVALADRLRPEVPPTAMAIAGVARVSPDEVASLLAGASGSPLAELRADVLDHLDASQLLSVAAVDKMLHGLANWRDVRERTGVVAGMIGRTARARTASERIYREELQRVLTTHHDDLGIAQRDGERVGRALREKIGESTSPVTAHTLMGLLPSLAAARVAGLFDLQGPNLVIDADDRSIPEALGAAERWLTCGTADVMLACMLTSRAPTGDGRKADGALVMCLTTPAFARSHGWTILGELTVGAGAEESILVKAPRGSGSRGDKQVTVSASRGLAGFGELALALEGLTRGGSTVLRWRAKETGMESALGSMELRGAAQ
jgi:acyl transferase domain-containing protein